MARVGHVLGKIGTGQVHFGQHGAGAEALGGGGQAGVAPGQAAHQTRGLACQCAVKTAVAPGNGRGAGHAALAEVLFQFQKKRQLVCLQYFKHGEHIAPLGGGEEVVAVGDALGNALQGNEFADGVVLQQNAHFIIGNGGVNRHDASRRKSGVYDTKPTAAAQQKAAMAAASGCGFQAA